MLPSFSCHLSLDYPIWEPLESDRTMWGNLHECYLLYFAKWLRNLRGLIESLSWPQALFGLLPSGPCMPIWGVKSKGFPAVWWPVMGAGLKQFTGLCAASREYRASLFVPPGKVLPLCVVWKYFQKVLKTWLSKKNKQKTHANTRRICISKVLFDELIH